MLRRQVVQTRCVAASIRDCRSFSPKAPLAKLPARIIATNATAAEQQPSGQQLQDSEQTSLPQQQKQTVPNRSRMTIITDVLKQVAGVVISVLGLIIWAPYAANGYVKIWCWLVGRKAPEVLGEAATGIKVVVAFAALCAVIWAMLSAATYRILAATAEAQSAQTDYEELLQELQKLRQISSQEPQELRHDLLQEMEELRQESQQMRSQLSDRLDFYIGLTKRIDKVERELMTSGRQRGPWFMGR